VLRGFLLAFAARDGRSCKWANLRRDTVGFVNVGVSWGKKVAKLCYL